MKIQLKPWALENEQALIELCNGVDRTYLSNRIPFPYTEADAKWWLNMVAQHDGVDGVFRAIVVDGKIVGNISVEKKEDIYEKEGEIGYYLNQKYWSKGIVSRAVALLCPTAFENLHLKRITGRIFVQNFASCRVLEKNGFHLEGVMKNAAYKNEKTYDVCIYGKLKEE